MTRFLVLFGILLVIAIAMIAAAAMQADISLMDTKATPLWLCAVAVAAYVAWRIDGVLKRRERKQDVSVGEGSGFLKTKVSPAQSARAARVAALPSSQCSSSHSCCTESPVGEKCPLSAL